MHIGVYEEVQLDTGHFEAALKGHAGSCVEMCRVEAVIFDAHFSKILEYVS